MNTILFIMGTRPEAIKLLPVYHKLKDHPSFKPIIVSTGQHDTMIEQVFDSFGCVPDLKLELNRKDGSLNNLTSSLFGVFDSVFNKFLPNGILVQGDTNSAFSGALAAFHRQIPVYHIEAGLRTGNLKHPFPEEGYRQMISRIATFNFAPTETAKVNLENEGISNVLVTGNTVIDALHIIKKIIEKDPSHYHEKFQRKNREIVLITGHRRENYGAGLKNICSAIRILASKYEQIDFVYPVHLNPTVKDNVKLWLNDISNVILTNPLKYDELIFLMMNSKIIISDSGGIQEEAPTFRVPVLVTRETTERPEAVESGYNFLVGTKTEYIVETFDEVYDNGVIVSKVNLYGDGNASERIISLLLEQ